MDRQLFLTLTTSSQWALFLALAAIIFSWIEKKRWMQLAGQALFVVLAIFSFWVMKTDIILVPEATAGVPAPPEAQALRFFLGLTICGGIALIGLVLNGIKSSFAKIPNLILVPFGLMLFFMVYNLQRL
ncbi:hypothetical protein [Mangrovibacterium marinum]|uniref:Uncharacterized protein n=1 Tax=Mangrovibacterium marinum TaxID=1639118 RepID=A0A2T5C592_9BACT|nr:hypothetical protein [Mangrovibacterium marinum]PTN10077.1 hypothetical protein C8N47_10260 [Mangrovibacterium marinum]